MITQVVTLFATESPPKQIIKATQGESDARKLVITILDDSGAVLPLTNKKAYLYVSKTDGKVVQETGIIDAKNYTATFLLHTQAATCPGQNPMYIELVDNTPTAILRVNGMVLDVTPCNVDEAKPSETVLTAAQQATVSANSAADKANLSAENVGKAIEDLTGAASLFKAHETNINNPHRVTAEQIPHTHSTSGIVEGIFSVIRGGTGANTVDGIKETLNYSFRKTLWSGSAGTGDVLTIDGGLQGYLVFGVRLGNYVAFMQRIGTIFYFSTLGSVNSYIMSLSGSFSITEETASTAKLKVNRLDYLRHNVTGTHSAFDTNPPALQIMSIWGVCR